MDNFLVPPDLATWIWGVIAAVLITSIVGIPAFLRRRKQRVIALEAKLSQAGDVDTIQKIGCACVKLTLLGKGHRPARVAKTQIVLRGFNALPNFQEAFGTDFGHVPSEKGRAPEFKLTLPGLTEKNHAEGWIIGKDEICRFVLPIQSPALPAFVQAKRKDVKIVAILFDGTELPLLKGREIQPHVDVLMKAWGNAVQTLKVRVEIEVAATSKTLPSTATVGKTNPNPLRFFETKK